MEISQVEPVPPNSPVGMSFVDHFNALPLGALRAHSLSTTPAEVGHSLAKSQLSLEGFAQLISPACADQLEQLALQSKTLTQQRFGRAIRLFAPLYLSNECINNCAYCGFSRDNPILRVTLSPDEVRTEAEALTQQGFRNVLLVAGEHPKFVSNGYVESCIRMLHESIPSISLELGPLDIMDYQPLVAAGAEGLVVYQETYDRNAYRIHHTAGPKKDFDWRLATPERAYAAGFRRIGIGALFGLSDWRTEAIALAAHAEWLLKHCWKAQLTLSLPRLRPCAGSFDPVDPISDRDLTQLICALRLFLPDVGIVLSTREPAALRNGLIPLGITLMSAGSHTEPGGYTGAGMDKLHLTDRGKMIALTESSSEWAQGATGQFDIADERTPKTVAQQLTHLGYEPVWKDWDSALTQPE